MVDERLNLRGQARGRNGTEPTLGDERPRPRSRSRRARSSRSSRRAGRPGEARGGFGEHLALRLREPRRGRLRIAASGRQGRDEWCRAPSRERRGEPSRTRRSAAERQRRLERSSIDRAPESRTVLASKSTRRPRTSVATISPRSLHRGGNRRRLPAGRRACVKHAVAALAATSVATICDASSCTTKRPVSASGVSRGLPVRDDPRSPGRSGPDSNCDAVRQPGSRRARHRTVRSVLARIVSGAGRLLNCSQASVAAKP